MKQIAKLLSLLFTISIGACVSTTASIETQHLDTGDKIILKFNGPFTYSYQAKGKPAAQYSSDKEDKIHLTNAHVSGKFDSSVIGKAQIEGSTLKYFLGPDANVVFLNDPLFKPSDFTDYTTNAKIQNKLKSEDYLDTTIPITFSDNLVEVTSVRKEKYCVDDDGEVVAGSGKTPNIKCGLGDETKETGKIIETTYSLAELQGYLQDGKYGFVGFFKNGRVLEIELVNINAVKDSAAAGDPSGTGGTPVKTGVAGTAVPNDSSGSGSVTGTSGATAGGCSLSHTESSLEIGIAALIFISIALICFLRASRFAKAKKAEAQRHYSFLRKPHQR